ncbi:hypothetical protein KAU43_07650 [candidate division WOR-3 bacterium]|nr:hypothetical protein [candidate division WOR-3 bacterium]
MAINKDEMRDIGDSMIDASKIIALSHLKVATFDYKQDINHTKKTITTTAIMTERPQKEVEALSNIRRESELMEQFWGMGKAEYLTIPRSIIQLMPIEWQNQLGRLMEVMDLAVDWHPEGENRYWVQLGSLHHEDENDEEGTIIEMGDPLQDYRHGNGYAEALFIKKQKELEEEKKAEEVKESG